ncbi:MAG: hypothetical protein MUC65_09645, partial [Pontiellaceae bacterium]|nr:hypothetical protein [Pontiellaceae bacterium]
EKIKTAAGEKGSPAVYRKEISASSIHSESKVDFSAEKTKSLEEQAEEVRISEIMDEGLN